MFAMYGEEYDCDCVILYLLSVSCFFFASYEKSLQRTPMEKIHVEVAVPAEFSIGASSEMDRQVIASKYFFCPCMLGYKLEFAHSLFFLSQFMFSVVSPYVGRR